MSHSKMSGAAPVALFTFNRLEHTRQTVAALARNELASSTRLFVFSDGPRTDRDQKAVDDVRRLVGGITGFASVEIVSRPANFGLSKSIIDGVGRVCDEFGRVIVLEDDMVTSPYFLRYMNDGLRLYEDAEAVISLHGYVPPLDIPLPTTFFLRAADCWGWATWRRGWALFEPDGRKLLHEIKSRGLMRDFDNDNSTPNSRLLRLQIAGLKDSWAIRWQASAFLHGKLTLFPGVSLLQNIGNDGSGRHCGETDEYHVRLADRPVELCRIPLVEHVAAREALARFTRRLRRRSVWDRSKSLARMVRERLT